MLEHHQLTEFLRRPREDLDIEVKGWLDLTDNEDRATLAKAVIALANHGGGHLVIGLEEDAGQFVPAGGRPPDLSGFSPDSVQDAIKKYVEPAVQCRTEHVPHPQSEERFPIVVVPGGQRVPVKAKRGSPDNKTLVKSRVYIRRPKPESEEPQTPQEWDQLFERCLRARREELLLGIRDLLAGEIPSVASRDPSTKERLEAFIQEGQQRFAELTKDVAQNSPARFPHGYYEYSFAIDGEFHAPTLSEMRDVIRRSLRNHSGWPPFVVIDREPYLPGPVQGAVESWLGREDLDGSREVPSRCDFWRIAPYGLLYTRRGFDEDGRIREAEPGQYFSYTVPIWRTAEAILQAHYVAMELGAPDANLLSRFHWHGLSGRRLATFSARYPLGIKHTARQNDFKLEAPAINVGRVPDALPEIVFEILRPLYELFDFFKLPKRVVEKEIKDLLRNTF